MKDFMDAVAAVTPGDTVYYRPGEFGADLAATVKDIHDGVVDLYIEEYGVMVYAAAPRIDKSKPQHTWVTEKSY